MRLSIDHRTTYRFSVPQARARADAAADARGHSRPDRRGWRIDVDCDARLRTGRDGFGNVRDDALCRGADRRHRDHGHGRGADQPVERHPAAARIEPLPPPLFLRSTDATPADAAIADFARRRGGRRRARAAARLNARCIARFALDRGAPMPGRPRRGVRGEARRRAIWRRCSSPRRGRSARRRGTCRAIAPTATASIADAARLGGGACRRDRLGRVRSRAPACRADEDYVRVAVALDALARRRSPDASAGRIEARRRLQVGVDERERADQPTPSADATRRRHRSRPRRPAALQPLRAEHFDRAIARLVRHPRRALHPIAEIDIGQARGARAQDVVHDDEVAEARARSPRRRSKKL